MEEDTKLYGFGLENADFKNEDFIKKLAAGFNSIMKLAGVKGTTYINVCNDGGIEVIFDGNDLSEQELLDVIDLSDGIVHASYETSFEPKLIDKNE